MNNSGLFDVWTLFWVALVPMARSRRLVFIFECGKSLRYGTGIPLQELCEGE